MNLDLTKLENFKQNCESKTKWQMIEWNEKKSSEWFNMTAYIIDSILMSGQISYIRSLFF
jgi:hypothetical protein